MKTNYIIIPFITIMVAIVGSLLTNGGMIWYRTIHLPSWTPPGSLIGIVWTILFVLATISALMVYNQIGHDRRFWLTIVIFLLNGFLNFCWSLLFFTLHWLGTAIFEAALLGLSVLILIILIWPRLKSAAILLIPYFLWVSFATYLTSMVWLLNK